MKSAHLNTEQIVKNLKILLNLKSSKELALKLKITPNALNMLITRNSIGTLLIRLLENFQSGDIPLDAITRVKNPSELEIYANCFKLAQLAIQDKELATALATLLAQESEEAQTKKIIKEIFEKFLAQTALEKIVEYFGLQKESRLRVLYFFLLHLEANPIPLDNIVLVKSIFIQRIKEFELEVRHKALFTFTIHQGDKDNLIKFLEANLDDASTLEVCLNVDKALKIVKEKWTLQKGLVNEH